MGVSGLWELLSPVGRRVPVERLSGKVVAVDASIWLSQFLAAMRDSEGMMMRNAHLIGFFRRCCKLRFHGIRPVFVFDGPTPAIKKRTLSKRRAQREKQNLSFKKAAEKLLLNRLKHGVLFGGPSPATVQPANSVHVPSSVAPQQDDEDAQSRYARFMNDARNPPPVSIETSTLPDAELDHQSASSHAVEEEDEDEDEDHDNIQIPEDIDELDVDQLASLPPGKQMEALDRLRMGMRARNRQEAASKAADPAAFSQQQIKGFLNATTLNHRIRQARGEINHALSGGKTRIASDPSRQIRFSKDARPQQPVFAGHHAKRVAAEKSVKIQSSHRIDSGVGWAARALEGYKPLPKSDTAAPDSNDSEDSDDIDWEEPEFIPPASGNNPDHADAPSASSPTRGEADFGSSEHSPVPEVLPHNLSPQEVDRPAADRSRQFPQLKASSLGIATSPPRQTIPRPSPPIATQCKQNSCHALRSPPREKTANSPSRLGTHASSACDPTTLSQRNRSQLWLSKAMNGFLLGSGSKSGKNLKVSEEIRDRDQHAVSEEVPEETNHNMTTDEPIIPLVSHDQVQSPETRRISDENERPEYADSEEEMLYEIKPRVDKKGSLYPEDTTVQASLAIASTAESGQASPIPEANTGMTSLPARASTDVALSDEDTAMQSKRIRIQDEDQSEESIFQPTDKEDAGLANEGRESVLLGEEAPTFGNGFSDERLQSLRQEMELENVELEKKKRQGMTEQVTAEMYNETFQLLDLFGFPYIESPGEAEAQCAFLNSAGLVDAVITEDSDVFLFGADVVYRNIFFQNKYAEEYTSHDVSECLGLSRNKLIYLALFLGSDYTEGVRGVGIVNATEIVEAFPWPAGPKEFLEWYESVTLLDQRPDEKMLESSARVRFCWKHRNVKRNWIVRTPFPSTEVIEAYLKPAVKSDLTCFEWNDMQPKQLASFCWAKLAWDKRTVNGVLGPVVKAEAEQKSKTNQTTIDSYFKPHRFASIRSKRLSSAVRGMAGATAAGAISVGGVTGSMAPKKRKRKATK